MKNKFTLSSLLIGFGLLFLIFAPKTFALENYFCSVSYPDTDSLAPFTYDACSYPITPDKEPFGGISCRPEGDVLRKAGSNPVTCVTEQSILDLADAARTASRDGFDSLTGAISSQCRDKYSFCSGACEPDETNACPSDKNRATVCSIGGCGTCDAGFVYCENNQSVSPPYDDGDGGTDYSGAVQCTAVKDGSTFRANNGLSCAELGRSVKNACTGECSGCPDGLTPSGREQFKCIPYGERFIQILEDGLAVIGGLPRGLNMGGIQFDNAYPYGTLGDTPQTTDTGQPGFYGEIFVEVDQADHLNWKSPSVPGPIQSLIAGSDLLFCDVSNLCSVAGQVCTAGLCNNPTSGIGKTCGTASDCKLGLSCDKETNKCIDPNNPNTSLFACTETADCAGQPSGATECVLGFCRNQENGLGDRCSTGTDAECAAGLICNADLTCVVNNMAPTGVYFAGLTNAAASAVPSYVFNADLTGYEDANSKCDAAYDKSHMCTVEEILTIINTDPDALLNTGKAWINGGPPGFTATANDCKSWQVSVANSEATSAYGRFWDFANDEGWLRRCTYDLFPFACCK